MYSWPVIIFLVIVVTYVGRYALRSYQNYREVEQEYRELTMREDEIVSRIQTIEDGLSLLESNAGRERIIRERFDVQKKGEEVVIFVENKDDGLQPPSSAFQSFTSFLKNLFGL